MPNDIVILDVETLGLHPDAPIWEFAALRRYLDGTEQRTLFQIEHDPGHWLDVMRKDGPKAEQFIRDYQDRYSRDDAITAFDAAVMINMLTKDAVIVGCNPSFDTERITKLMARWDMAPQWHYRPLCVTTMAAGHLHGAAEQAIADAIEWGESPDPALTTRSLPPPWSSDQLSRGIGVDPDDYKRHSAMGDVDWAAAQWDVMTGQATP